MIDSSIVLRLLSANKFFCGERRLSKKELNAIDEACDPAQLNSGAGKFLDRCYGTNKQAVVAALQALKHIADKKIKVQSFDLTDIFVPKASREARPR
ncbi:hypothetical protein [Pandoraea sputorum]|uniref:hypothetical protein n=1 Tax=Pandoraea sputorum TaxID=93222 RepID=UPI0012419250|nr:hypothetical protein [Pandoraea sputorum]VVE55890.1 hypothetical protein PSP20601_05020 [Pandoraea sputorum]